MPSVTPGGALHARISQPHSCPQPLFLASLSSRYHLCLRRLGSIVRVDETPLQCKEPTTTSTSNFLRRLGDMFYADEPPFECNEANINSPACKCTPTYLRQPPFKCMAGDFDNARDKMVAQVRNRYRICLEYGGCSGKGRRGWVRPLPLPYR